MSVTGIATGLVLPPAPTGLDERRRLASLPPREAARELEALLVAQMIGAMRRTVPSSGMLAASASRRLLDGAFDHELARALVRSGDLGIARQLAAQLERTAAPPRPAVGAAGAAASPAAARAEGRVAAEGRAVPGDEPAPAGATAAGAAAILPVAGRLTSGFGARPDPFTGEARFHGGVDLAAPRGTPVRAVAAGEVVFAGRRGRAGNVVEVRHPGGLTTTYAHLERAAVAAGQKVDAGEVLATVGASGRATGPHLHFAAAIDGQPIDPAELFVGAGPPERAPGRAG